MPITDKEVFDRHVLGEYSDIAAVNLLSSVTKGFQMLNELLEDFKTSSGGSGASGLDMMDGFGMGGRFGGGMPDDEDLM